MAIWGPAARLSAEMQHGTHFAGLDEKAPVADGCAELDNLVVACRRAASRGDVDLAVRSLQNQRLNRLIRRRLAAPSKFHRALAPPGSARKAAFFRARRPRARATPRSAG